jgi:hypothetical protein
MRSLLSRRCGVLPVAVLAAGLSVGAAGGACGQSPAAGEGAPALLGLLQSAAPAAAPPAAKASLLQMGLLAYRHLDLMARGADGGRYFIPSRERIAAELGRDRQALRITPQQSPLWDAFVAAVQSGVVTLRQAVQPAGASGEESHSLLLAELTAARGVLVAGAPLYEALSSEQKAAAAKLAAAALR